MVFLCLNTELYLIKDEFTRLAVYKPVAYFLKADKDSQYYVLPHRNLKIIYLTSTNTIKF